MQAARVSDFSFSWLLKGWIPDRYQGPKVGRGGGRGGGAYKNGTRFGGWMIKNDWIFASRKSISTAAS